MTTETTLRLYAGPFNGNVADNLRANASPPESSVFNGSLTWSSTKSTSYYALAEKGGTEQLDPGGTMIYCAGSYATGAYKTLSSA